MPSFSGSRFTTICSSTPLPVLPLPIVLFERGPGRWSPCSLPTLIPAGPPKGLVTGFDAAGWPTGVPPKKSPVPQPAPGEVAEGNVSARVGTGSGSPTDSIEAVVKVEVVRAGGPVGSGAPLLSPWPFKGGFGAACSSGTWV